REIWRKLDSDQIYFTDRRALSGLLAKAGFTMAATFFGLRRIGRKDASKLSFPFKSILDTTPFLHFLHRNLDWSMIQENLKTRAFDAIAVSATHMITGRLTLFVQKGQDVPYSSGAHVGPVYVQIAPKHILASAAIPMIFPLIRVNGEFYGDGSMRQNTPMSPAVHMGANRLLVISLRDKERPLPEIHLNHNPFPEPQEENDILPRPADVLGKLLNTIFQEKLDYDLVQMQRINHLIDDFETVCGPDSLEKVIALRDHMRTQGVPVGSLQRILPFVISPSEDIGQIATDHFRRLLSRRQSLNAVQRFFAKAVESSPQGKNDFISYLLFEREYLEDLIQLGHEDARRNHDYLAKFLTNQSLKKGAASMPR
ncbi:MAG: hypothetical protein OEW39_07380, partial [Deltaproteobacteria bacterium]|nr:hypothetical protein [Deltaproteobacteria bacterium]